MPKKDQKNSFENSLNKLEKIVSALENGDVPLEDSLKMYEEGIQLSLECMESLNKAELKIKKLTKDLNGKFHLSEFEES
jgi:exodeoxyribonuclease VII small subunit